MLVELVKPYRRGPRRSSRRLWPALPAGNSDTHRLLAQPFEREGNPTEARRFYEREIELATENTVAVIFLGTQHERERDPSEAEHTFRRATECTVGSPDEAWLNLGLAHRRSVRGRDADMDTDARLRQMIHAPMSLSHRERRGERDPSSV